MRILKIVFLFQLIFTLPSYGQNQRYWIQFEDKGNYGFQDIQLSQKSLERRTTQNITLDSTDIPIFQPYLDSLDLFKVKVQSKSRWFNAISATLSQEKKDSLQNHFSFIKGIQKVETLHTLNEEKPLTITPNPGMSSGHYYGQGWGQIWQIRGNILHELGYRGQGILIAVLDAGFRQVDEHFLFQNNREKGKIIEGLDFVRQPDLVNYQYSTHGLAVLSTMASSIPGTYVGTAPDADYVLIRTENAPQESLIEEDFWLMGAEFADSIGADIINSSLGYTQFDDSLQNHSYQDLDGESTLVTRAANKAFEKGILVVSSNGNSGNDPWKYLGAPADGKNVLAIGAVYQNGNPAAFSSFGPTVNGLVKPNVSAMGALIPVAQLNDEIKPSYGTSFSAPVISGMSACLWQFFKENELDIDHRKLKKEIEESAHLYLSPDSQLGYGIPNFKKIVEKYHPLEEYQDWNLFFTLHNEVIYLEGDFSEHAFFSIVDATGRTLFIQGSATKAYKQEIPFSKQLPKGIYFLSVQDKNRLKTFKILR
ncbi:MAG: S8 family peptidase [Flavobacteriales bacterium]|jgi:hypothetical protein|nr:S8 family peptidase [Flavobacteriales bacterium]